MGGSKPRSFGLSGILLLAGVAIAPILLSASATWGQFLVARSARNPAAAPGKAVPMVNVDDELSNYLEKARKLIAEKSYSEAIEILQAMMRRQELGFVPTDDSRRFVSLRVKAVELIGKMDEAGLKKYRANADPQAQKLYEEALAKSDSAMLREVTNRFLYTTYGTLALEDLAQWEFDRGRYLQAAHCWHQLAVMQKGKECEALLVAKTALAYHLSSESEQSQQMFNDLQARFPESQAELGGQMQDLAKFVQRMRSIKPTGTDVSRKAQKGWPGVGALAGNFGAMSDCDVVLLPRWRFDPNTDVTLRDISGSLIASKGVFSGSPGQPKPTFTAKLRNGHVQLKWAANNNNPGGGSMPELFMPPVVHPLVVGEAVVFRQATGVEARHIITGEFLWRTVPFPMERKVEMPNTGNYYYGGQANGSVCDTGRYALTAADGKIFMLGGFMPAMSMYPGMVRNPNASKEMVDSSSLAALSIETEGTMVWRIGEGKGDDDVIKSCKFLSAPAYHGGRLYVLAMYTENYYLLCLNADTGALVWKAQVAQTPPVFRGYYGGQGVYLDMGSIPAVADGRVYVLTNTGVLAAYEADTGQPMWAYQYESVLGNGVAYLQRSRVRPHPPANPVLAVNGRVIFLPADSQQVIALSGDNGKALWQADRQDQDDLTGIDENRVLISGDRLIVLSTADGKKLQAPDSSGPGYSDQAEGVIGRPAVTPTAVLASGLGKVLRLDLNTYRLTSMGPSASEALLGDLVGVDGKLIAANSAGVCAYFSYDMARDTLTERIAKAPPQEKGALLEQRALLSFSARRFANALEDFHAWAKLAKENGDLSTFTGRIRPQLHRTYVAMGNEARTDDEMLKMFQQAQAFAESNQEKAHMLLRLAKYYRKAGDLAKAAAGAQELGEQYGREELVDVHIGVEADDLLRSDSTTTARRGKDLAQGFIREMIEVHGRDCYSKFDADANIAMIAARKSEDAEAILAVADRWPNSTSADLAKFSAAETYYTLALGDKDKADDYFGLAIGQLSDLSNIKSSPRYVSATVALAAIYARGNRQIAARLTLDQVRDLPPDTLVEFADLKGKLGDLVQAIQSGKVPTSPMKVRPIQTISVPLKEQFHLDGDALFVFRDQEGNPLRVGESVFVLQGNRVILLDTASHSADEARQRWVGLTSLDPEQIKQYAASRMPPGMSLLAGMSKDGKILAVADRTSVTGFEMESARRAWHKTMSELGVGTFVSMAVGEGVMVIAGVAENQGKLTCVDLATGERRWWVNLVGGASRQPNAPPMIGGGVVVARHNNGRIVTAIRLDNAAVANKWEGTRYAADVQLTREGILAMFIDNELSVRETTQIDKPFWIKKYEQKAAVATVNGMLAAPTMPCLLSCENDRLAVSSGVPGEVQVLAVSSGKELANITLSKMEGAQLAPVIVQMNGTILYVQCSLGSTGVSRNIFGRLSNSRGLVVQKYDLAKPASEPVWTARVDTVANVYSISPLTIGQKHLVVMARHSQMGVPYFAHILDLENGQVREKVDLRGKVDPAKEPARRVAGGSAVMTNGHLLVETSEGIKVLGGQ